MLNTLLKHASKREIWLFYGVQNSDGHIMKQHFSALAETHDNFHLNVCYSKPKDTDQPGVDYQHHSRVDIPLLRNTLKLMRYQFYICGPGAMMQSLVTGLQDWGVQSEDIYYEAFGPSTVSKKEKTLTQNSETLASTITFSKSGKSINWNASFDCLLDLAEDHGIEVGSGCRSGICGSCQTAVQSGELDLNQQPDFDITPGHCLMCISKPKGDLTIDA
jgi:ferredoxin-NADP reductase